MTPVLSRRALGRATLARQLLLERETRPVAAALEHLVGLQAQVPLVPHLALWDRLAGYDPGELDELMTSRQVVRTQLMRTTIHTVTAADALALRPLLQPVLDRTFASTAWGQRLRGQDVGAVVAEAAELLAERPLGPGGVAARTGPPAPRPRRRGGRLRGQLLGAVGAAPAPRALGSLRCGGDDDGRRQLGSTTAGPMTLQDLVERYLTAFGPASVRDVQAWCGLTRLREVVDGLGPRLRRYRTEDGAELVDVPDGPLPDADSARAGALPRRVRQRAAVLRGPFPGGGRGRPRPPAGRTRAAGRAPCWSTG